MHRHFFEKKSALLVLVGFLITLPVAGDKHPKAAEIQRLLDQNPLDSRIPAMMILISRKSEDLNVEGYELYVEKRYNEAIKKFEDAVRTDPDNSFAWYNMACCYALLSNGHQAGLFLKKAVDLDWYYALQLMVDTDLDAQRHFYHIAVDSERSPFETGPFLHRFDSDGLIDLFDNYTDPPEYLGSGFYSVFADIVVEFFPHLDSYLVDGPDGVSHIPSADNVARLLDVDL